MSALLKNVVLMPNLSKQIDPLLVRNLLFRLHQSGCSVRCAETCRGFFSDMEDAVTFVEAYALFRGADVLFVLGGDGSIIEAARCSVGLGIPIVGINCGRLGYLAEIEIGELDLVDQVLAGSGTIEKRIMLDVEILRGDSVIKLGTPALNDVVLTNGPVPRLLSFELYCNGELVENCYADGMIISTPTGSTAYSMSAGGPILDPCLDCFCTTPICPQTMNNRPVIFRGDSILELHNMRSHGSRIYVSEDGRDCLELEKGDVVRIRRSGCHISLIRVKNGGFLSALRRKLS